MGFAHSCGHPGSADDVCSPADHPIVAERHTVHEVATGCLACAFTLTTAPLLAQKPAFRQSVAEAFVLPGSVPSLPPRAWQLCCTRGPPTA
jgi:hypothetical protein